MKGSFANAFPLKQNWAKARLIIEGPVLTWLEGSELTDLIGSFRI